MTRKKKEVKEEEILLSPEDVKQVWDFYQFAKSMQSGIYPSGISPLMVNSRMQDVNLNLVVPEQDKLDRALQDPKNSEETLRGMNEYFEIVSQPYKRIIHYLGSMLSFDLSYVCTNADKDDYGTQSFKRDEKAIENFLDRFDYESEFIISVKEMLRQESHFFCPRFEGERIVLQELPANYMKITGRWDFGLLTSMNLFWFNLPGVDLNLYPSIFKKYYSDLWGSDGKIKSYNPALSPDARSLSSYIYWQDLPVDVAWCFKLSRELITQLPFFTGMYSDLLLQPIMRTLQKNINMAAATRMLKGEVPYLNGTTSKVADSLAITPESLGKFLGLVSSALSSSVKMVAAPLSNMEALSFPSENEMYPSYLKNLLASSGVNTSLIFTNDARANILESRLSQETDSNLLTPLYNQFNGFMNYHANKMTKKFKFAFEFEGTRFSTDREERQNQQKDLMERGIILPKKIGAAYGIKPQNLRRMMEQAKADGFADSLTPILMANQIGKESKGGRPPMSDSEIGDAGAQTKESGSNISKPKLGKAS